MTTYNLSKGLNNDINGQVLKDWINTNKINIHNIIIKDVGIATIENINETFYGCQNIISINLSNFNTANVTNMSQICTGCTNLINISNFNTSNVTDMSSAFEECSLTDVPNFNTIKVTNMAYMFLDCINLVNVPQLNTSNVADMQDIFYECNNLSNASIQNIINMCLNSNVTNSELMNLSNTNAYSPLSSTKFDSSYYSNRLTELDNAGWEYDSDEIEPIGP